MIQSQPSLAAPPWELHAPPNCWVANIRWLRLTCRTSLFGKQGEVLKEFIEIHHGEAKADLATAFVERCRSFCSPGGAYAVVTPQKWLFLTSYRKFRERMLREQTWEQCWFKLGPRAFRDD